MYTTYTYILLHYILTLHQYIFTDVLLCKPAIYFGNVIKLPNCLFHWEMPEISELLNMTIPILFPRAGRFLVS